MTNKHGNTSTHKWAQQSGGEKLFDFFPPSPSHLVLYLIVSSKLYVIST